MLRIIALALVAFLGVTPVTDDLLRALSERVSILEREAVRGRRLRDAHDADRLLGPRSLSAPIGVRGMSSGGIPDLATPLLSRLRDDAGLAGLTAGRTDTFAGYANILADPTFDTLGASPSGAFTTIGTSYTAISPEWEAKYVLNSGTVATTRTMGRLAARGDAAGYGYGVGSSGIGELVFLFGVNASDMTIYLRPTDTYQWESPLPSWLVATIRAWLLDTGGGSTPNVPATAYLEIVDASDTVVATGDSDDLMNLMDLNEFGALDAALEGPTVSTGYRPRLRIDLVKAAGATGQTYILLAEPLFAGSDDGSAPAYTPAVGSWLPGAPGRQLVSRSFVASNVAAGATVSLDVSAAGFPSQVPEVYDGSIVGITYRWTANITGGSHSLRVLKNGSVVWTAFSGASAREDAISQPPWVDTFEALDKITVEVVTGGGFLPAGTNDIVVELYLLLDFDAR